MAAPVQIVGDRNITPRQYNGIRPYSTSSGTISAFKPKLVTTAIGDDFGEDIDLSQLLDGSPAADELLRDLSVHVSKRGVCFFHNQSISYEQQKEIVVRMAHLTGSPASSSLHVHPVSQTDGGKQLAISNKVIEEHGPTLFPNLFANHYWHVDSTFEEVGPAYSCLKLREVPESGGDTLWCSLFDCVDKLSPSFVAYLETLTAEHDAEWYKTYAIKAGIPVATNRGSPENSSTTLKASHPVIATHPVTGWKCLTVHRAYTQFIHGMTKQESDLLLEYLYRIISDNHDIQVRFRWEKNSVALWDNRSCAHCVTNDYYGMVRLGARTLSIGEHAEVNPSSMTKRQALAHAAKEEAAAKLRATQPAPPAIDQGFKATMQPKAVAMSAH